MPFFSKPSATPLILFFILLFSIPAAAQSLIDSTPPDSLPILTRKVIEVPPFKLINTDTLELGPNDELVQSSFIALGMPSVYDALHAFNARRSDHFGGYINGKINAGLENIRKKGFKSDIKKLYIQIDPKTLTVYWFAIVGPSEDGKCYVRVDSRGSAGGGSSAVLGQLPSMHNLYPTLKPIKLLEFNENVIRCYDWNSKPLKHINSYVNIQQHFFKYCDLQIGNSISLENYVLKYPHKTDGSQLPGKKHTVPVSTKKYKVKAGDTLSKIAKKYHTSTSKIKTANRLKSDTIRVGQILKIP